MSKLTDQQRAKGRERFLGGNPSVKARIDALSQVEADHLGITLDHYRESETMRELQSYAHAQGRDSVELFWSCVADTADELRVMLEKHDAAIKRNLGL